MINPFIFRRRPKKYYLPISRYDKLPEDYEYDHAYFLLTVRERKYFQNFAEGENPKQLVFRDKWRLKDG